MAIITARCFQPVILDLLLRAEERLVTTDGEQTHQCQKLSYNFSILLHKWPHLNDFVVGYFKRRPSFFDKVFSKPNENMESKLLAAKTAYNLLRFKTETFRPVCRWESFFLALKHSNKEIKWFAAQVVVMLIQMDEQGTSLFLSRLFTQEEKHNFLIRTMKSSALSNASDVTESQVIRNNNNSSEQCVNNACFTEKDLSGSYATICGMILPKGPSSICKPFLVMVDSTRNNLHSLVLAVAAGSGVLLEGPVGCGKTSLVECLAAMTGRSGPPSLLKVQLGDQTDSKV